MTNKIRDTHAQENRDPITGAPGAHPIGTGLGAAAGFSITVERLLCVNAHPCRNRRVSRARFGPTRRVLHAL
ncbi:MAG: hypothetical protein ACXWC0_00850, partial [Burkholderiales bacterium]